MRWSKNEIFLIDYNNAGNSFCTFKLPVSEPSLSIHFCKLKMQEYLLRQRIMNLSISKKLYICYQKNCAYMERSRRWSIFSQVIVWAQKIYVKVFRQGKIFRIFFCGFPAYCIYYSLGLWSHFWGNKKSIWW